MYGQELKKEIPKTESVKVSLQMLQRLPSELAFEIVVSNAGDASVFIVTEPVRNDASKGLYISLNKQDPSIVEATITLFSLPRYCTYTILTQATLKRLEPGEKHTEKFSLRLPLETTEPPYETPFDSKPIDHKALRYIRASVATLPDEAGIQTLLRRKEHVNPVVNGQEKLNNGDFKGKQLFEVQTLISSSLVSISELGQ